MTRILEKIYYKKTRDVLKTDISRCGAYVTRTRDPLRDRQVF